MLIYGLNPLIELLKYNPKVIQDVYLKKDKYPKLFEELIQKKIKVKDYKIFQELKDINTQGIIIKLKQFKFYDLEDLITDLKVKSNSRILILDQIFDPQNFGAIIRNAAAFEADAIIFSNIKNSPFNSTVVKASAGTWVQVKLCQTNSIINAINVLKRNNFWIVSTVLTGEKKLNQLQTFKDQNLAIVLGSEGKGIRNSILKNTDIKVHIEISNNVNSLNVSVTSALILNELYNSRGRIK